MKIDKLKAQREKLKAQFAEVDAKIAKAEKAAREAEQRELVRLIQSRGITAAQLSQFLDTHASPGAGSDGNNLPAVRLP
ncbi:MAG: DUF4315 family protein [Pseudomonadota bacterium]